MRGYKISKIQGREKFVRNVIVFFCLVATFHFLRELGMIFEEMGWSRSVTRLGLPFGVGAIFFIAVSAKFLTKLILSALIPIVRNFIVAFTLILANFGKLGSDFYEGLEFFIFRGVLETISAMCGLVAMYFLTEIFLNMKSRFRNSGNSEFS